MPTYRRPADRKTVRQVASTNLTLTKHLENLPPGGIGDDRE